MTTLQLYKFCEDKEVDWLGDELIIWIPFYQLKDFTKVLGYNYLSEGDVEVGLLDNCIALDIIPICEYFGIDPEEILERGE